MADKSQDEMLYALTVMGRILLVVPLVVGIIVSIIEAASPATLDRDTILAGSALVMLCGLVTLGYVAVQRFRRGLQGKD